MEYYRPTEEQVLDILKAAGRPQSRNQVFIALGGIHGRIDWKATKAIFETLLEKNLIKGEKQFGQGSGGGWHAFNRFSPVVMEAEAEESPKAAES